MSTIASQNRETSSEEAARLLREIAQGLFPPGTSGKYLIDALSQRFGWRFHRCKKLWHREACVKPEELDALRLARKGGAGLNEEASPNANVAAELAAVRAELERVRVLLGVLFEGQTAVAPVARMAVEARASGSFQDRAQARDPGARQIEARP